MQRGECDQGPGQERSWFLNMSQGGREVTGRLRGSSVALGPGPPAFLGRIPSCRQLRQPEPPAAAPRPTWPGHAVPQAQPGGQFENMFEAVQRLPASPLPLFPLLLMRVSPDSTLHPTNPQHLLPDQPTWDRWHRARPKKTGSWALGHGPAPRPQGQSRAMVVQVLSCPGGATPEDG